MLTLDQFKCAQQFEDYLSDRSSVVHLEEILIFEDPFQSEERELNTNWVLGKKNMNGFLR